MTIAIFAITGAALLFVAPVSTAFWLLRRVLRWTAARLDRGEPA